MLMPTNSLSVQSVTVYLCALKFLPNQNLSFGLEHSNMVGLNASVSASTLKKRSRLCKRLQNFLHFLHEEPSKFCCRLKLRNIDEENIF